MRLIDADRFRRFAHEQLDEYNVYSVDEIFEMIDEQPTAYHLDKVVKELDEQAEECRKYWQNFDDEDAFGGMNAYCHAIRIVKRGGCNE